MLLSSRAEDDATRAERRAMLEHTGLEDDELVQVRLEAAPMPALDLDRLSGVIVGGSPFTTSDPDDAKSPTQRRVEREIAALLDEVVARDIPFLGACYGIGTLGVHRGGTVTTEHGEPVGAAEVSLTDAGREDPLFGVLPATFDAYVGHKEGAASPPPGAVLLATGVRCPMQAFRVGHNLYATQFHPELTVDSLVERVTAYRDAGYFGPDELEAVIAGVRAGAEVVHPPRLLGRFVELYAR